jgi:toxin YoeB
MRNTVFEPLAFTQFTAWAGEDKKIHTKIVQLINDIHRSPFDGLGKPEPLKYVLLGYWSRRITEEHRLVYRLTTSEVVIISCKFHYPTK